MDQKRYQEIQARAKALKALEEARAAGVFTQICREAQEINRSQRQGLCEELDLDAEPTIVEYEEWQRMKAAVNADKSKR